MRPRWRKPYQCSVDQRARQGQVAGRRGVVDRLRGVALLAVPGACPQVKLRRQLGLHAAELVAQQLAEQVVTAVPAPLGVERHEEQARPFEPVEHPRRPLSARDRVAERAGQPFQHRGAQQELAHLVGLAVQHLEAEVVDHRPVVAGERGDEVVRVLASPQGERSEAQSGCPALRALLEAGQVGRVERKPEHVAEEGAGLVVCEAQVAGPHLDQLAARSHPAQRERRLGPVRRARSARSAAGARAGRRQPRECSGCGARGSRRAQHERPLELGQLVDQGRQHHAREAGGTREVAQRRGADLGLHRPQRGDHLLEQLDRVVVARIEGQPGERPLLLRRRPPLAQERGLTRPGGRQQENDPGVGGRRDGGNQPVAATSPRRVRGACSLVTVMGAPDEAIPRSLSAAAQAWLAGRH
jgi:hypothetical protein